METQLSEVIKKLVEKVSLKEISTRDFVAEMSDLYQKIDHLEQSLVDALSTGEIAIKEKNDSETKLSSYRKEFVIPAEEYEKREMDLKYANLDWQTEKKYQQIENKNLKEIVSCLTATKSSYENRPDGYNKGESIHRASLQ